MALIYRRSPVRVVSQAFIDWQEFGSSRVWRQQALEVTALSRQLPRRLIAADASDRRADQRNAPGNPRYAVIVAALGSSL